MDYSFDNCMDRFSLGESCRSLGRCGMVLTLSSSQVRPIACSRKSASTVASKSTGVEQRERRKRREGVRRGAGLLLSRLSEEEGKRGAAMRDECMNRFLLYCWKGVERDLPSQTSFGALATRIRKSSGQSTSFRLLFFLSRLSTFSSHLAPSRLPSQLAPVTGQRWGWQSGGDSLAGCFAPTKTELLLPPQSFCSFQLADCSFACVNSIAVPCALAIIRLRIVELPAF